jgi:hypothetical protein
MRGRTLPDTRDPGKTSPDSLIEFTSISNNTRQTGKKTAMHVDHHDLYTEFPDMRDAIDTMKANYAYFAAMVARYDRLTGRVEDLEEHDMPVGDFTIEDMKKARVKLKDDIFHYLQAFRVGQKNPA